MNFKRNGFPLLNLLVDGNSPLVNRSTDITIVPLPHFKMENIIAISELVYKKNQSIDLTSLLVICH
jgi:hypothetical protein